MESIDGCAVDERAALNNTTAQMNVPQNGKHKMAQKSRDTFEPTFARLQVARSALVA